MLKENQKIKVQMTSNTKKWYSSLGYDYKLGESFEVIPEHLPKGSNQKVEVQCDICGKESICAYGNYLLNLSRHEGKFVCKKCIRLISSNFKDGYKKRKETCLKKYGTENPMQNPIVKEKQKQTNLEKYGVASLLEIKENRDKKKQKVKEKYGVENISQLEETKEKVKQSFLNKYGVDNPMKDASIRQKAEQTNLSKYGVAHSMQNDKIKEKLKQTNLEKYGVTCSLHAEEIALKVKQTNLEKYGVEYPMQNKEIKAKTVKTLYQNGAVPTSQQQKQIYDWIIEENFNCILNYPESVYNLDCAILENNIKIDVEYDGWPFHKDLDKDKKRDEDLIKMGYKVLRVRGGKSLPDKSELFEKINCLINTDKNFEEIILPEWANNIKKD